jgi:HSP20 family protein
MERTTIIPMVTVSHDINQERLEIDVRLPDVDEKKISLDMKNDSFCISAPKNGTEYSGCFLLDHEVDPGTVETKYEDGLFRILTPYKNYWDRLREGFMGRPISVRG